MVKRIPPAAENNSSFAFMFLLLYVAMVFIRPHQMFEVSINWVLIKVFAIMCLLTTLIAQRPLKIHPQHWMLFLLTPLIIISGFFNGSGMIGVSQAQIFLATSIIPLFLLSNCITSIKRHHCIMFVCLIAALFMVHNGHTQQTDPFWQGWAFDTQAVGKFGTDYRRITYLGFFSDPNDLGMFLVMTLPFAVYFLQSGKFIIKLLMLFTIAAILYGVFITYSRGTQLGIIGLLGAYYLIVKFGDRAVLLALLLAPIGLVAMTILQSTIDASAKGRLYAWYDGIHMLLSNLFLGVGRGNFIEHHERTAHNSFILVAAELGIPGYSLWGGALLFTLVTGYFFIQHSKNIEKEKLTSEIKTELAINKTMFFSMIGFLITSFFLSRSYTVVLFVFIGITLSSHHRVVKILPEMQQYFTPQLALKCMLYSWSAIFSVYAALKVAL